MTHRRAGVPGSFEAAHANIALCGARGADGAKFTPHLRYTKCPTCRRILLAKRAEVKAKFDATFGGG